MEEYQTATNSQTGAKVIYLGGKWQPVEGSATGPSGAKAFKVGGKWVTPPASSASAPKAEAPAEKPSSALDQVKRAAGLTARAAITGATALPAALNDAIVAPYNYAAGKANEKLGTNLPVGRPGGASGMIQQGMDKAGLPQPQPGGESLVQDIASSMVGAGSQIRAVQSGGKLLTNLASKQVLEMMGDKAGTQMASAITGATAGNLAKQGGMGPVAQYLAALVGGGAPYMPRAAAEGVKVPLRGSDSATPEYLARVKDFEQSGTTPTIGQVGGTRTAKGIEGVAAHTPGASGPIIRHLEAQQADISNKAQSIADAVSRVQSPAEAGRIIEQGISGKEGFVQRFRAGQASLYNKLDQFIKPDQGVSVANTEKALQRLSTPDPRAQNLTAGLASSKIRQINEDLQADLKANITPKPNDSLMGVVPRRDIPYSSLKRIRTQVGQLLDSDELVSGAPRAQLKQLYGALSEDMKNAVVGTGNPKAVQAFNRANKFTEAGHARIDDALQKAVSGRFPEQIYDAATNINDMQSGAGKISSIMKSLSPTEREAVRGTFVSRMGNDRNGNFSTGDFLSRYSRMSEAAKKVMFADANGDLRKNLDYIARTSDAIQQARPARESLEGVSKSAAKGDVAAAAATATAAATGHPLIAAAALMGAGAARAISQKMLTNPAFVKWLATSVKKQPSALLSAVNNLSQAMAVEPQDVQEDAARYAEAVKAQ